MMRRSIAAVTAAAGIATLAPAAPAVAAGVPAVRIVLDRSGGFAGRQETFVVSRSTAGGRQPLRLAGSFEFRRLRASYVPQNPCCDRFSYRVVVSYRGGFRKTVSTVQGAEAPRVLWDVIRATEQVGAA